MSNQNLREQLRQQEAEALAQSLQFNRWSLVMISVMIRRAGREARRQRPTC